MNAVCESPSAFSNAEASSHRTAIAVRALSILKWIAVVLWLACATGGLGYLANYAAKAGPHSSIPARWPDESSIRREPGSATLLIFLHPRCPCSSATLSELERALAWSKTPVGICAVFYSPANADTAWARTRLWNRMEELRPGCTMRDDAGREASVFGVASSGHVLLYDANGTLAFEGGITGSRGHEGDNSGCSTLTALLAGQQAGFESTPVYGCLLGEEATGCCASNARVESQP